MLITTKKTKLEDQAQKNATIDYCYIIFLEHLVHDKIISGRVWLGEGWGEGVCENDDLTVLHSHHLNTNIHNGELLKKRVLRRADVSNAY